MKFEVGDLVRDNTGIGIILSVKKIKNKYEIYWFGEKYGGGSLIYTEEMMEVFEVRKIDE